MAGLRWIFMSRRHVSGFGCTPTRKGTETTRGVPVHPVTCIFMKFPRLQSARQRHRRSLVTISRPLVTACVVASSAKPICWTQFSERVLLKITQLTHNDRMSFVSNAASSLDGVSGTSFQPLPRQMLQEPSQRVMNDACRCEPPSVIGGSRYSVCSRTAAVHVEEKKTYLAKYSSDVFYWRLWRMLPGADPEVLGRVWRGSGGAPSPPSEVQG